MKLKISEIQKNNQKRQSGRLLTQPCMLLFTQQTWKTTPLLWTFWDPQQRQKSLGREKAEDRHQWLCSNVTHPASIYQSAIKFIQAVCARLVPARHCWGKQREEQEVTVSSIWLTATQLPAALILGSCITVCISFTSDHTGRTIPPLGSTGHNKLQSTGCGFFSHVSENRKVITVVTVVDSYCRLTDICIYYLLLFNVFAFFLTLNILSCIK